MDRLNGLRNTKASYIVDVVGPEVKLSGVQQTETQQRLRVEAVHIMAEQAGEANENPDVTSDKDLTPQILVPAQVGSFFYPRYHLSALQNCALCF